MVSTVTMTVVDVKSGGWMPAGAALTIQTAFVRRLAAWYLTGPLGHLVAGVCDWAELLGRYCRSRLRRR